MGIFKRIFGQSKDIPDEQLQKEANEIRSGKYNKVYPILKPGDWVGIKAGALRQTLIGAKEAPELVVAFGYDTETNFVFLMPKDLEGKNPDEVLHNAFQNLDEVDIPFEVSKKLDNKVLTASGNDFSSEKILSEKQMLEAHKLLDAEEIIVSIPRRRCMMVTSKYVDNKIIDQFIALHQQAWNDDSFGNPPISKNLFIVQKGQITAAFDPEL